MRLSVAFLILPMALMGAGAGNPLVPDWVRPGVLLTYDLITGSVGGSLTGWDLNEHGDMSFNGRRYSGEREGHSSHGLIEATVAGIDSQTAALAQTFYLIGGTDSTPMLSSHQDMLVTADTGGDLWMHPQKQALMVRQHPWAGAPQPGRVMARATTWRAGNQSWPATEIISLGDSGKTFWVYEQTSGRLLYLSRVTRTPPTIRDPSMPLRDSVSYATILRFVAVRQLSQPWVNAPMPEWTRQLHGLSYRGQTAVQFPGSAPGGQALTQDLEVERRGGDWLLFHSRGQAQGQMMASESKLVSGPGCLLPYIIPPAALARLRPGQELDRDPHTGYSVGVAAVDAQTVTLQLNNSRQVMMFVFDRAQGLLQRMSSRERSTVGTNMFIVREMRLAGKR
jgi:hypothetical protein